MIALTNASRLARYPAATAMRNIVSTKAARRFFSNMAERSLKFEDGDSCASDDQCHYGPYAQPFFREREANGQNGLRADIDGDANDCRHREGKESVWFGNDRT